MVVVAVDEVEAVELVHALDLVLCDAEVALNVLDGRDAVAQGLVLHVVPELHALAVARGAVAGAAVAAEGFEGVGVAGVLVDAVDQAAELVAVVAVAGDALVDVAVGLEGLVGQRGVTVGHVHDQLVQVVVARQAALVVGVEVVGVVRDRPALLHPVGALVLGGGQLDELAVGELTNLGGVLHRDLVPLAVVVDDVFLAGILGVAVGHLSVDDRRGGGGRIDGESRRHHDARRRKNGYHAGDSGCTPRCLPHVPLFSLCARVTGGCSALPLVFFFFVPVLMNSSEKPGRSPST